LLEKPRLYAIRDTGWPLHSLGNSFLRLGVCLLLLAGLGAHSIAHPQEAISDQGAAISSNDSIPDGTVSAASLVADAFEAIRRNWGGIKVEESKPSSAPPERSPVLARVGPDLNSGKRQNHAEGPARLSTRLVISTLGEPRLFLHPKTPHPGHLAIVYYRQEIEDSLEQYPDVEEAIEDSGFDPCAFISAIIQIESSGNPQAVNPTSQAAGLMQVMPYTSRVPMQDLFTPDVGIAEGVRDLNDKLAKNDGDLYEAMFDYSGGLRHVFWGRMVGWTSKEAFEQAYWQRLLSAYEGTIRSTDDG